MEFFLYSIDVDLWEIIEDGFEILRDKNSLNGRRHHAGGSADRNVTETHLPSVSVTGSDAPLSDNCLIPRFKASGRPFCALIGVSGTAVR